MMMSEEQVSKMTIDENILLKDYENNNNWIGIKIQKAKIELLDKILEISD